MSLDKRRWRLLRWVAPVEWLVQPCFTPIRFNGIAAAVVKTFGYARFSILPDAATVIARCRRGSRITMKFTRTQACPSA
jgi:hypothetical protein